MRLVGRYENSGRRWSEVLLGNARGLVPLTEFMGHSNSGFEKLAEFGILLVSDRSKRLFKERIEDISEWKPIDIADRRGWHEKSFVFSHDFVVAAPFLTPPEVVLGVEKKWSARGTPAQWQETAKLLEEQSLVIFCASAAFVPPLHSIVPGFDNIATELIWDTSTGKSTVCRWVGSIYGGDPDSQLGFMEKWLATPNGLEPIMRAHRDCLLVFDEGNLSAADVAAREVPRELLQVIFRLSEGVEKARYNDVTPPSPIRLSWLSSSNTSIIKRLNVLESEQVAAATVRVITLPGQVSEKFGVFDRLPLGFADSGKLISHLNNQSKEVFGHPIRAFLRKLVLEYGRWDGAWVRAMIRCCVEEFIDATGVDRNNGPKLRVARSFGLIYAAGYLARLWNVLPANWRIGWAAMRCYRTHLSQGPVLRGEITSRASRVALQGGQNAALHRIVDYARRYRERLIPLQAGKVDMDDASFALAYGFLKTNDQGLELQIPRPRMHREFRDYLGLMRDLRDQGHATTERGVHPKLTTRVPIRRQKALDRVYSVRLPPGVLS